jgi:hypothetical protein
MEQPRKNGFVQDGGGAVLPLRGQAYLENISCISGFIE